MPVTCHFAWSLIQFLLIEPYSWFLPIFSELEEHWVPHGPFSLQGPLAPMVCFGEVLEWNQSVLPVCLYKTNKETGPLSSPRRVKKSLGSIKSNQIIFWSRRLLKWAKKTWQQLPCPTQQPVWYLKYQLCYTWKEVIFRCLYSFFLRTSAFGC